MNKHGQCLCYSPLPLCEGKWSQFTVNSSVWHTKETRGAAVSVLSLKALFYTQTHTQKTSFEIFQYMFQLK